MKQLTNQSSKTATITHAFGFQLKNESSNLADALKDTRHASSSLSL
jgi:hypothetical protein